MNEFDDRYYPLKRRFPNRVKQFSRDRELRFERIRTPGFLLEVSRLILPAAVPDASGKRLLFVSDFHWHDSPRNHRLLNELSDFSKRYSPDILLCGGELCSDAEYLDSLPPLLTALAELAPVSAAVSGNWETGKRWLKPDFFKEMLKNHGIKLLSNESLTVNGFYIFGLPDVSSLDFRNLPPPEIPDNTQNILLVHSPDAVVAADKGSFLKNFHLAFCGHTHGGQIRLPLIGSLYCPSFYRCKFDRGIFSRQGNSLKMLVSSGIGEHRNTPRILCPPEIITVEFE